MPRNAGRRAPDQAPTPCETVDGAWDLSLAGMEHRVQLFIAIVQEQLPTDLLRELLSGDLV